jgi:rare lipoprotein A
LKSRMRAMKFKLGLFFFLSLLILLVSSHKELAQEAGEDDSVTFGRASFYHDKFNGRKTSSGEIFSQKKLTAAHKTLPMGTYVKVTNLKNRKSVIVKVNDRLPPHSKRSIDMSKEAARELHMIKSGLAKVSIEIVAK